jgi:signal transduction histidine kinase/ActR/RegA family two-component response regulator
MPAKRFLKEKDKKFRLLFEENPQPMWVLDREAGRFLEVNAAARALYGYGSGEFEELSLSDIQNGSDSGIGHHRTKGGRAIDVELAVHEIEYGGRRAELAVIIDITGRRQLEDQLRQAQKMEAVGMLAGGIAHDFNNLLTIINGYSQLILNALGPTDTHRHSVEQIMKAGERAAALTQQLLAFSRRQVLQPRVVDLNKLVGNASTMLQRLIGEDIELHLDLGTDLGRVNADPGQIEQVVMNLAVNARDAMPRGGVLIIETANIEFDEHYAAHHINVKAGSYVRLAVSDNGAGMDEATRARLFEPFFTTKHPGQGTGLGLSTVFGIVRQSGGSLEVYSEPGRGTTVKIYLPRIDQPVAIEAESHKKRKVVRGTETILLAEDDEMVRTLVRETLERQGYRVLETSDPAQARRTADQHKGTVHLLITDVIMPKINGRELAQQLLKTWPDLKVLYMSGYTDNAVLASGILEKDVAFLQKPFTPAALAEKVRDILEGNGKTKHAV